MSYNSTGIFAGGICEKVLIALSELVQSGNLPETRRTKVGFIQFLNSPLNTGGVSVIPVKESNKIKTVRIKYLQRITEDFVGSSPLTSCTPDVFDDYNEVEQEVTKFATISWGVSHDELKKVCTDPQAFIRETLMLRFDALARKINADGLTDLAANMGVNVRTGLATATNTDVLCTDTGGALPKGLQDIWQDYSEFNEYTGTPVVIGQGLISRYTKTLGAGCCNNQGVDMQALSSQMGYSFFLDTMAEQYLGDDNFAVLVPSMVHFVEYNLADSDSEFTVTPLSSFVPVTDPITGITYDFTVIYDDCTRTYFFKLEKNYDFFFTPVNSFSTEDPLYGTNGTLLYNANEVAC